MSELLLHEWGGPDATASCLHCPRMRVAAAPSEECPARLRAAYDAAERRIEALEGAGSGRALAAQEELAHRHAALLIDVGTLLALAADLGDGEAHRVARVGNTRIVDLTQRAEEAEAREARLREALTTARECWDGMRGLIAAHGYAEEDITEMDAALSEPAPAETVAQAHGNTALTDPLGQHDASLRQQEREAADPGDARREEREAIARAEAAEAEREEP